MTDLLSRYAESLFWFGRYLERTACLARLLEVQTSFDQGRSNSGNAWSWILTLYDDQERFRETYGEPTTSTVIRFYVADRNNLGSIAASIRAARENARTLRAIIPMELWHQVNVFYNRFRDPSPAMLADQRLSHTCQLIKKECYALEGVADATIYRDEAWNFLQLGLLVERADQMSRLLDVRFAQMRDQAHSAQNGLGDFGFWSVLLRSVAAQQAYLRTHPGKRDPESVARFLIFDPALPRSIVFCATQLESLVHGLRRDYNLRGATNVLQKLDDVRQVLDVAVNDQHLLRELHTFNDQVQRDLMAVTNELATHFFSPAEAEADSSDEASPARQSQSRGSETTTTQNQSQT
jgi:uncharacterized alpha-E superfamily protein